MFYLQVLCILYKEIETSGQRPPTMGNGALPLWSPDLGGGYVVGWYGHSRSTLCSKSLLTGYRLSSEGVIAERLSQSKGRPDLDSRCLDILRILFDENQVI